MELMELFMLQWSSEMVKPRFTCLYHHILFSPILRIPAGGSI